MPEEPTTPAVPQLRLLQLRDQINSAFDGIIEELDSLVEQVATSAREQHEAAAEARIAAAREELEAAADTKIAEARAEAEAVADARIAEARSEVEAAADAKIAELRSEAEAAADAKVAELRSEAEAAADARIAEVREELEAAADARIAEARAELQAVADARVAAAEELAEAAAEQSVAEAHVSERECDLECIEKLLDGVRRLDAATSLSQVLEVLCDEAAEAAIGRVAVLVARDRTLRGFASHGFESTDVSLLDLETDDDSIPTTAARNGRIATTRDEDAPKAPPFAPLPEDRVGVAVPLTVAGRTVAVLYADDVAGTPPMVPSAWPEVLELLSRHAARCLELLTVSRAYGLHTNRTGAPTPAPDAPSETAPAKPAAGRREPLSEEEESAERYARLLISEIKLYHEDAVNAGRRDQNLLKRLGPQIERARRLYEQRVPEEVRSRADHFTQELIRTLANGDPRLLGQAT